MNPLEQRITALEERNKKVEQDKAWETSNSRKLTIIILTYLAVVLYFKYILHITPWLNALVPVIGFVFSTLTVGFVKSRWLNSKK